MTGEQNTTETSWWHKGLAKARSCLPAIDVFVLDPEYLTKEKKKTKSLIGGAITALVPAVLIIYLAVLLVGNQRTPPTRNSEIEAAAWIPPLNLTAPRDGYVVHDGDPGNFQCDTILKKFLGTKQNFVPVCPDVITGLAYDAGEEEEGVARISSRGSNYGIDISVEFNKNIAVDQNGGVYLIGKHKPYVKKDPTDSADMFYFSRFDSSVNGWEDIAPGTKWPDKAKYTNAKFTEWVDNQRYLVLVMDDNDDNTILRVWDFEKNTWRHDSSLFEHITAIGVAANSPHLLVADQNTSESWIADVDLSKFLNGESNCYSELSNLRTELRNQNVVTVEDITKWAGDIAVIGKLSSGNRLLLIWDSGGNKKARDLEIAGAWSGRRGVLHVYQTKLFVGGWSTGSSAKIVDDGEAVGTIFALETIEGNILTDTSNDNSVEKIFSNKDTLFALGSPYVYDIDLKDITLSKVSGEFTEQATTWMNVVQDCTAQASGRIFCTGNFDWYDGHISSGVQRSIDQFDDYIPKNIQRRVYSRPFWGPFLPFENAWEKNDFDSERTTANTYVFGSLSGNAEPLRLSSKLNSLQLHPQVVSQGWSGRVLVAFNNFVVSFVKVEDNTIDETYGQVRASKPELGSVQYVENCLKFSSESCKTVWLSVEIWELGTLGSCMFDPTSLDDFKQNCKEELPIHFPFVIDDQWPVLMLTPDEHGVRKWVKVAETPSRLRLSFFKGFSMKTNTEINSNKQSVAALFGQAAGTLAAMLTAGHLSKLVLTTALKKWSQRKEKKEKNTDPNVENTKFKNLNPVSDSKNNILPQRISS